MIIKYFAPFTEPHTLKITAIDKSFLNNRWRHFLKQCPSLRKKNTHRRTTARKIAREKEVREAAAERQM